MLKALIKKQFLELNSFYFQDKKTGKLRSKRNTILTVVLYAALLVFLGFAFFAMGTALAPLLSSPTPWLYYSITGITAVLLGVFGSVFNTYAGMYHAKDNELLLSMPIPPSKILLVRIIGVGLMSLMYTSVVWIPVVIARFVCAPISASGAVFSVLLLFFIVLFVTVLSCFLGWIVALLSSKFKNKSILTVLFALIVFAAYYYFCSQSYSILESLMMNSDAVGQTVKSWMYPFYLAGMAGEGSALSMLLFCLIVCALFALTRFILSKTFVRITTRREASAKKVYKEKASKAAGTEKALFRKELKRFTSSANYMLNCALSTAFMPILAVVVLVYRAKLTQFLPLVTGYEEYLPVFVLGVVIFMCAMNDITAPSVSLEGKSIWILQSLPVPARKVLDAKKKVHWVLTVPPAALLTAALSFVLGVSLTDTLLMLVMITVYIIFAASLGLWLNLRKPNLSWTNEAIPVKQSMAALIMILGGFAVSALFIGGGFLALKVMPASVYIALFCVLLIVLTRLIDRRLNTKGAAIFNYLS